jgi:hypothetical protein
MSIFPEKTLGRGGSPVKDLNLLKAKILITDNLCVNLFYPELFMVQGFFQLGCRDLTYVNFMMLELCFKIKKGHLKSAHRIL